MIIDGKVVAQSIKDKIKSEVEHLSPKPVLAVIQVGDNPASTTYVNNKIKACEYVGMHSMTLCLSNHVSEEKLLSTIGLLNKDMKINGILVQLPLPDHIDVSKVIKAIDPIKDVDCFHPINVGTLSDPNALFKPCTPAGVIEMLKYYEIPLEGSNCVIVGRSDIVGRPLAQLLLNENATVTVCHSKTRGLKNYTQNADIVIAAVGKPKLFNADYFHKEDEAFKNKVTRELGDIGYELMRRKQTVIDVGINRDENNKLCGDVDFDSVKDTVDYISPVPGGVGPMTIAMLLQNTLKAYKEQSKRD